MEVTTTKIQGVVIIEPKVFGDHRGFFMESYSQREFAAHGLHMKFVQDNHSKSSKGVLRGLHYQYEHPQGKLLRVITGRVYDVAVDIRPDSPTYGEYVGVELSGENHKMLYIPEGLAHGFMVLEDETHVMYKATDFYHPEFDAGIIYNDPTIGVNWSTYLDEAFIKVSEKDSKLPSLDQAKSIIIQ